jgi:DNA replication protein DnaC
MTTTTTSATTLSPADLDALKDRAAKLKLNGVLAHWDEYAAASWLKIVVEHEEEERARRSLERRLRNAKIGRFKLLADFDWSFPKRIDREAIEELFALSFLADAGNVVVLGPNGVGKTTIAQNLVHQAVLRGYTARFVTASEMLNELAQQDSPAGVSRRLRRYTQHALLAIDEVGYLSYDSRHADLLFEVVSRRQQKSTVITTNKPFSEWSEVFPNATCVVALVDRLIHKSEVVEIHGESYRLKEAKERETRRANDRAAKKAAKGASKR